MLRRDMIDKTVPIPLYFQLQDVLLKEIKDGTYPPGSTIPTEQELSEIFDISRTTIRHALTELVRDGWLIRAKSKGTIVAQPKISQAFIQTLKSFHQEIEASGRVPRTQVLAFEVQTPSEQIAKQLQLEPGEKVIFLSRVRYADDEPIVAVRTYLPYRKCHFVMEHDLVKEPLYSILQCNDNTKIHQIRRVVEAMLASERDAKYLQIEPGQAIQQFSSTGYNAYGQPIEYSVARYRGDRSSFEVIVAPSPNA